MSPRDSIRATLACIPAEDRELWLRIGMAVHSELSDEDGFALFDEWSRGSETYSARAVRDTWKSFKPGRITIGTLWHEAKARGYSPREPAQAQSVEEAERLARERTIRRAADEARFRERADRAAREAVRLWGEASDTRSSAYLTRKGVQGYGVRCLADGTLLIPLHNAAGELVNVQRIAPAKPTAKEEAAGRREKRFLPGGRKSGLWHLIGELPAADAPDGLLLIAEGYATAASLHEATEHPVAVAFDAGNLAKVAQALRALRPAARLLLCGDDDRNTEARTGTNPGRVKATAAARSVAGAAVFPEGLPESGSDFNDLAQHAGPAAVRELIERAVGELATGNLQAPARKRAAGNAARGADGAANASDGAEGAAGDDRGASGRPEALPSLFDRFALGLDGVFYAEHDQDGRGRELWVCSPLAVSARTRDGDGEGWGYLLEFDDPTGKPRTWAMPARMLAGDGAEYRAALLGMGLRIAAGTKARNLLTQYLQTRAPAEVAQCTDRIGWHGRAFVLPRETIQQPATEGEEPPERIVYQTDGSSENPFRVRGTLEAWKQRVAAPCVGNSRLLFAVSCAFAGPLMRPAGLDSGGFHLRGDSSCGKTTALRVAASVYGAPGYLQRWRATDNASG